MIHRCEDLGFPFEMYEARWIALEFREARFSAPHHASAWYLARGRLADAATAIPCFWHFLRFLSSQSNSAVNG